MKGLEPSTFCMAKRRSGADWLRLAKSATAGFGFRRLFEDILVRCVVRWIDLVRRASSLVRRPISPVHWVNGERVRTRDRLGLNGLSPRREAPLGRHARVGREVAQRERSARPPAARL